nr:hypothetical protein [uncultured Cohaesibacter sp.]
MQCTVCPWLRFNPHVPPGPIRGDACGDPTFTTSLAFDADFDGLAVTCHISYHFDPACCLGILIDTDDGYHLFAFETRAYSLRYALAHLAQAARQQRIELPIAGLAPGVKWLSKERDCAEISVSGCAPMHPCTPLQSRTAH